MKRNRSTAALVPSPAIQRRLFLVGCPGSGAEVVQRLLAEHLSLYSFPKTHLFLRIFGMRGRRLPWAWVGITLGKERRILERLADRLTGPADAPALPPRSLLLRRSLNSLLATFDRLALASGCRNWLDTTPRHLVHARLIERLVPRARIIHVVRDGRDVVAAQCSIDSADPTRRIAGKGREPRAVVAEWNRALEMHARCLGRPGHVFVLLGDLLANPDAELSRIAHECGLHYPAEPIASTGSDMRKCESGVALPARGLERSRFCQRFSPEQRRRIEKALDLSRLGRLAERVREQSARTAIVRESAVAIGDEYPSLGMAVE